MQANSTHQPLLSLVIPYHNSINTIQKALLSINNSAFHVILPLTLTRGLVELVCVDNASTDGTRNHIDQALSNLQLNPLLLVVHAQETRKGVGYARTKGVQVSKGLYVGFVDADDTVHSLYLTKILSAISMQPDVIHLQVVSTSTLHSSVSVTPPMSVEPFLRSYIHGWWCWSFITRKELFGSLSFNGDCYEDVSLFPLIISQAKSVTEITGMTYCYQPSQDSLTKKSALWRLKQWESQFAILFSYRTLLLPFLQKRMRFEYVQQKIRLRSQAGLPIFFGVSDAISLLRAASTPGQLYYLLYDLSTASLKVYLKAICHHFRD